MCMSIRNLALIFTLFFATASLFGQAPPCRPGTMAAVVGTSCSVGSIILTFGNDFSGFFNDPTTNGVIDPASIGFTPVSNGTQVGFTLQLNFNENPNEDPSIFVSAHSVRFSYTPQAAPNTEIRSQSVSMDAAIGGAPAFVNVSDQRIYPNSPFPVSAFAALGFQNGPPQLNRLSDSHILEVPGFQGGANPFDTVTTDISSESIGAPFARLTSATFLYTTGPVVAAPLPASVSYKTIDLPGVPETFVANITNSGRTVGTIADSGGLFHGYIAEADGVTFTNFDFPAASATFASGLNERGDVVGEYTDSSGHNHGFSRINGAFSTIDVPDSRFTAAVTINDKGQIVGEFESQDRGFHGFLLENGNFTIVDHGPGTGLFASSAAFGINNSGEIAGEFFDPDTFRGYTQKQASFQTFDVPGQGDAVIEGINNPGNFVGTFNDIDFVQHGFLQIKGTISTVDFPAGFNNFALAINASGQIVGQYSDADGLSHSYLAVPAARGGSDQQASMPSPSNSAKADCNSEAWQLKHAQRHHLTACGVAK